MARILVTGSADGIGRQTALDLVAGGHEVVLHARNEARADDAARAVPGAAGVAVGDLSSLAETVAVAASLADRRFDVVVHNAGVYGRGGPRTVTVDGLERTFQVNVLAPYVLTAAMPAPGRLVYLTSSLQAGGEARLDDLQWERRPWTATAAYSDSKVLDVTLAFAVARCWPDVLSNAVDPGWIRTAMGGSGAPDDLPEGAETQVWLSTSADPAATVSGVYFHRRQRRQAHPAAGDVEIQDGLLDACAELSGVGLPGR